MDSTQLLEEIADALDTHLFRRLRLEFRDTKKRDWHQACADLQGYIYRFYEDVAGTEQSGSGEDESASVSLGCEDSASDSGEDGECPFDRLHSILCKNQFVLRDDDEQHLARKAIDAWVEAFYGPRKGDEEWLPDCSPSQSSEEASAESSEGCC